MKMEEIRCELCARLRARRDEIEQAILIRVHGVSDPRETADPEYVDGLRRAVAAVLDYGIDALERGEDRVPPIPISLLSQARLAARSRVSLDTVLRRYFAGYMLLGDFVVEEADRAGPSYSAALRRLLRGQATLLDRLIVAVSEEYSLEQRGRPSSAEQRRGERIERLLAGELLDTAELAYDFEIHHVGLAASGPASAEVLQALAKVLDRRLSLAHRTENTAWAWLASRRRFEPDEFEKLASRNLPIGTSAAIGETGEGISGWRLTHRQAMAALRIAQRGSESVVRYADVALLASILRDDLLVSSLRELYLAPLARKRDGGVVAQQTLSAYFAAQRNVSSAAASLGVSRQTIGSRLRTIEESIGRPLSRCAAEMEAALLLDP